MTDLDAGLHFRHGLILLTNTRLLNFESAGTGQPRFHSWKLAALHEFKLEEMGATIALHLMGVDGMPLGQWRVTSGCLREAEAFLARFREQCRLLNGGDHGAEIGSSELVDDEEEIFSAEELESDIVRGKPLLRLLSFETRLQERLTLLIRRDQFFR